MFGQRYFLEPEIEAWHIDCWAWLLRNVLDGWTWLENTPFILPNKDFFPPTDLRGHDRARYLLTQVQSFGPTKGWRVDLQEQFEGAREVDTFLSVEQAGPSAVGTFRSDGNRAVITYQPGDLKNPQNLIGTMAHEVGHFLNGQFPEPCPGGWDLIEPATDVTAAFLGFGVFLANSRFDYRQTQDFERQGWSYSTRGYLTEAEWAFSIAMFAELGGHELDPIKPYLKSHIWSQVRRARKYVRKHELVQAVIEAAPRPIAASYSQTH